MDRTADVFLQRAFLELDAFSIPEVGTFVRPISARKLNSIPWQDAHNGKDVISLLDFIKSQCKDDPTEAEAIHAKIRVSLRSSLKQKNSSYHISNAGTIRLQGSNQLTFSPEPNIAEAWFPGAQHQKQDINPEPEASKAKKYVVGSFLITIAIIALSGFFVQLNDQNIQKEVIAKAPAPSGNDSVYKSPQVRPRQVTNSKQKKESESILPKLPTVPSQQAQRTNKEGMGTDALVIDPNSMDKAPRNNAITQNFDNSIKQPHSPNVIPEVTKRSQESPSKQTGPMNYVVVASLSSKAKAEEFCQRSEFPTQCQLLHVKGTKSYRVSFYQDTDRAKATEQMAYYRAHGFPKAWLFPVK